MAERYHSRDKPLTAAALYRAVFEEVDEQYERFEEVDEQYERIDSAYDHSAQTLQRALDGYVACIAAANPSSEEFDRYAKVLETRATTPPLSDSEQFQRALDDLEDQYDSYGLLYGITGESTRLTSFDSLPRRPSQPLRVRSVPASAEPVLELAGKRRH